MPACPRRQKAKPSSQLTIGNKEEIAVPGRERVNSTPHKSYKSSGNFLVIQWLDSELPLPGAQVPSMVKGTGQILLSLQQAQKSEKSHKKLIHPKELILMNAFLWPIHLKRKRYENVYYLLC